jgi:polyferredoxin
MAVLRAGEQGNLTFEEQRDNLAAQKTWSWGELVLDFVLQAALLLGLAALSVWLWPHGLFDTPAGLIKPVDWLRAAGAVWIGSLCIFLFYFVVVEPAVALMGKKAERNSG